MIFKSNYKVKLRNIRYLDQQLQHKTLEIQIKLLTIFYLKLIAFCKN